MNGEARRDEIVRMLTESSSPLAGVTLAKHFDVSRQVIVQDIALLRAKDWEILSTNRGYLMNHPKSVERIFWVCHNGEQIEEELNAVVDLGGVVLDVAVQHQVYGELRAPLNIRSRRQVQQFLEDIQSGRSKPLTNLTSGHHCHKICAESEEILDMIEETFKKMGIFEK